MSAETISRVAVGVVESDVPPAIALFAASFPAVGVAVGVAEGVGVGTQVNRGSGVGFQGTPGVGVLPLMTGGGAIGTRAVLPYSFTSLSLTHPMVWLSTKICHHWANAARPMIGRISSRSSVVKGAKSIPGPS
ncbi:MAG: hypothetical protein DCC51_03260 [Anaerolineae bacterium]|nr:MAG: hypothetical protein DCC51_03260 [Anaerolineae bacterium]